MYEAEPSVGCFDGADKYVSIRILVNLAETRKEETDCEKSI
jgi:hypothetical protein